MKKIFQLFIATSFLFFMMFGCTLLIEEMTFQKTYGGPGLDRGIDVLQLGSRGYIVVGVTVKNNAENQDIYLVRTDAKGDSLWTKTYGGKGRDNGWAVLQTEDRGFIIVGFSESFGSGDMDFYLIRLDDKGDTLWSKTYGGTGDEYCWDMDAVPGKGFILIGETGLAGEYGEGNKDFLLLLVDEDGEFLWEKTYGGPGTDRGFAVHNTTDGGFIMIGSTTSFGEGDVDAYILKTDPQGNIEWTKTLGTDRFDMGHDIQQRQDGGYVVFGYTESFGAMGKDVWCSGIDSEGKVEWSEIIGGPEADHCTRGTLTKEGEIAALGYTKSFGAGHWDVYFIRMNAAGDTVWTRTFGAQWPDTGYGFQSTRDGGYILTGQTWSYGRGDSDLLLIKTDAQGRMRNLK
jgi:hypothetical protein